MPPLAAFVAAIVIPEVIEVVVTAAMTKDADSSDITDERSPVHRELDDIKY